MPFLLLIPFPSRNSSGKYKWRKNVARWTRFLGCDRESGVTWKLKGVSFHLSIDSHELRDIVQVTYVFRSLFWICETVPASTFPEVVNTERWRGGSGCLWESCRVRACSFQEDQTWWNFPGRCGAGQCRAGRVCQRNITCRSDSSRTSVLSFLACYLSFSYNYGLF